jgi:competence protein ComEC
MIAQPVPFWKKAPMFRIVIPFTTGIIIQWYYSIPLFIDSLALSLSVILLTIFFFLSFFARYRFPFINGTATTILFISMGAFLTYKNDIRHNKQWFANSYSDSISMLVTLNEPPVEKIKSVKAEVSVNRMFNGNNNYPATGKIIVYFQKDSLLPALQYGSQVCFKKSLQEIRNTSNPGGFDYKQYALFHDITHQVYLQTTDYVLLPVKNENKWNKFIYSLQEKVLAILRKYIQPEKELGLSEALLIGYKNDLDKTLVQSYSNTGVVHIIAISGLHLGLIYWLLLKIFQPLQKRKKLKWLRPILIVSGLWIFTCLAGAQPSVLRSALMFTCIALGESLTRKTSMYNTLSLSAFLLLCYNPFWLWDVGFQLSYAAVISIVLFSRPVYNVFYFKNKIADHLWKLNSVTISAQLLTLPIILYYFHQFPNYFLVTNLVAVPLSSIILMAEISLCTFSFIPFVAIWLGKITSWLVWLMNAFIEKMEALPFALWNGFQLSIWQAVLLFIIIVACLHWLIERSKTSLKLALVMLLAFVSLRSYSFIKTARQEKIIIYNAPQKKAIDIIEGFDYYFIGDSSFQNDVLVKNFYLSPTRTLYRIGEKQCIHGLNVSKNYIDWQGKHILLLDQPFSFTYSSKQKIDLLIVSGKSRVNMKKLAAALEIKQLIIDGTVPFWKANYLLADCDSLHIPCYDVSAKGAFAMNLR